MSAKRDYYEVLGVSKTSTPAEIKSQYRKLALKFHPDRNKSAEAAEHFKEISEAYAILSDSEKRQVYDQHGHMGVDGRYTSDDIFQGASDGFSDMFERTGFESIFETFFGQGGGSRGGQQRGDDILYHASLTLEDVFHGKMMEIVLSKEKQCHVCNGSGCPPGTQRKTCRTCNGQGQVRKNRDMGFTSFVTVVPCPSCGGRGSIIENPCNECEGKGIVKGTKTVKVQIPPGVENGDYTVLREGNEVPHGINGDLIVRIEIQSHKFFKRDGMHIFYDHDVSMVNATLGCDILVPTLEGTEKVKVTSGSQPNKIIKLRGKGLPKLNSRRRGDQYVRLVVNIPQKLNKQQKRILEDFRSSFD